MTASRSLVLREPGVPPLLEVVEVLDPGPGEVRVRLSASGICATDLHAVTGEQPVLRFPTVLGHEGAGVVDMVGEGVEGLDVGDHVVIALYAECGECRQCLRGRPDECDSEWRRAGFAGEGPDSRSRVRQGEHDIYPLFGAGTLAELTTIRAAQAIKVARDLSLEALCLMGCCVATGVGAVLNIARVEPGDSVLVVGCGGVGLNVIQGSAVAGATTIIAADIRADQLELARTFGATHVVDTSVDPLDVRSIVPDGVDVAFEVVGSPALIADALLQSRVGGSCVLVGLTTPGQMVPVDGRVLNGARRLLGCRGGGGLPRDNIALFADLYRQGRLRLDELIGQSITLDDVEDAFALSGPDTSAPGRTVVTFT